MSNQLLTRAIRNQALEKHESNMKDVTAMEWRDFKNRSSTRSSQASSHPSSSPSSQPSFRHEPSPTSNVPSSVFVGLLVAASFICTCCIIVAVWHYGKLKKLQRKTPGGVGIDKSSYELPTMASSREALGHFRLMRALGGKYSKLKTDSSCYLFSQFQSF